MNEEVFTITMPEAEYCLRVCELATQGTSGSDLSNKFRMLQKRLEAELHKPANLNVSLSAEEKNELVEAVMIYELLVREKYDVLRDHFNLQNIPVSKDEIRQSAAVIGMAIEKGSGWDYDGKVCKSYTAHYHTYNPLSIGYRRRASTSRTASSVMGLSR